MIRDPWGHSYVSLRVYGFGYLSPNGHREPGRKSKKTRPLFSLQRLPGLVFLDLLRLLLIGSPSNQKRRLEMLLNLLEI